MPNLLLKNSVKKILFFCFLISTCFSVYGYAETTLKIGVYNNKPTIFVGDDGRVQGLFVDILEEVAKKEHWQIEYVFGHFSDVFNQLKAGEIDILPALAYSTQREEEIDYTNETIMVNWAELYTSGNRKLTSLLQLQGEKIAVKQGDIHFAVLKKLTDQFNISCRFLEADEYETVFEMLQAEFVHIGVVNRLYGNMNKQEYGVKESPVIYNPIEMRFGATKGKHHDILAKIDSYMLRFSADQNSIYYQSISKWLVVNSKKVLPGWVYYLFVVVVGTTLFFFVVSLLFRRQVKRRTEELAKNNLLLESQILERIKAEERLKISEERSRTWLEHSPVCTGIVDLDFNLQYMSSAGIKAHHIKDITPLYGKPYPFDFYPESFKKSMNSNLEKSRETGEIIIQEASVVDLDGSELWFHSTIVPVNDDEGRIEYIIVVSIDITEPKKAEREKENLKNRLSQAQKMEAIGTLAGGVAHDLNNILSGIVNYPELLLLEMPEDSPYRKSVTAIQESGYRAVAIVQDLLTLARRGVAVLETTNLNELIKSYLVSPEGKKVLAEHPLIAVKTDLQENLFNTKGSPVHLLKTIMNLVTNSLESIKGEGGITIKTENRYVSRPIMGYDEVEEGDYVTLIVSDTGQGIAAKHLERIFEPFFTNKNMGKSGSGLGLPVVWGTVKDHHGYIDVQSVQSVGTTFTLYLPMTREELEKSDSERRIESYMGNGETILVVDDVKTQRDIASTMLMKLRYNTLTAASGEEALEVLERHPADLIVLDMLMPPGIDGLETLKQVVKLHPQQKTIIASGYSETERVLEAKRLGATAYIKKPYSLETIGVVIRQELSQ